jgi:hypothetical protein
MAAGTCACHDDAMSRARTIISLAVVAATSFALAACGGDDDSSGSSSESSELAAPLIDALAVEFDAEMGLTSTEAECFATRFVDAIGAEELIAAGLTADALDLSDDEMLADMSLNDDQANGLADLLLDGECISAVDMLLGDPDMSEGMTAEQATCMSEAFTASESVREVMVASFLGEEVDDATGMAMFGELMMIMGNCGLEM